MGKTIVADCNTTNKIDVFEALLVKNTRRFGRLVRSD